MAGYLKCPKQSLLNQLSTNEFLIINICLKKEHRYFNHFAILFYFSRGAGGVATKPKRLVVL